MIKNKRKEVPLYRPSPLDGYSLVPLGLCLSYQRTAKEDIYFSLPEFTEVEPSAVDCIDWDYLRPHQKNAIYAALKSRGGVIEIPTGGGKSEVHVVLALLFSTIGAVFNMNDGVVIEDNFKERWSLLQERWGVEFPVELVNYDDVRTGKVEPGPGMIINGSPAKICNDRTNLSGVVTILTDEGHHWTSGELQESLLFFPDLQRSIALSGTPFDGRINFNSIRHTDLENAKIIAGSGPLIYSIEPYEIAEYVDLPDVANVHFVWTKDELRGVEKTNNWINISKAMKNNIRRVRNITAVADAICAMGRVCIVPFGSKESAIQVMENSRDPRVVCWFGSGKLVTRLGNDTVSIEEMKRMVREGKYLVLLTTSHVDESLDLPDINTTFLTEGKKLRRAKQRAGRSIRKGEVKSIVINLHDNGQTVLESQAVYRSSSLASYYRTKEIHLGSPLALVDLLDEIQST